MMSCARPSSAGRWRPAICCRLRWWEQLWAQVVMLRRRYRLPPAKDWWEDDTKVEALAGLAAWVARYDSGEWDDPPGKLRCSTT